MFGKKSIIKQYKYKLRPTLTSRYGASTTYTKGQVDKTIDELGFDKKHRHYAYLMYCDVETFTANCPEDESTESMNSTIASATSIGFFGALFGASYYSGSSDDGGSSSGDMGGGE